MGNWDDNSTYVCGTCLFFKVKNSVEVEVEVAKTTASKSTKKKEVITKEVGRCKRHAPTMNGYPVSFSDDEGCGDHRLDGNKL